MMMGGLHPVEQYEYLARARAKLLDWVRPLTLEQYTREFPFGRKTIRTTLVHTAGAEWNYNRRLRGEPVPPLQDRPFTRFNETAFEPLEHAWRELAEETRATLREITDWNRVIEYRSADNPTRGIRTSTGGGATQLLFHEVHHRAQVMAMLRQLGVAAQDLDYSVLMVERFEVNA